LRARNALDALRTLRASGWIQAFSSLPGLFK
jgi:hypothetical protein